MNLYGFCGNDPINGWDELGLYKVVFQNGHFQVTDADTGTGANSYPSLGIAKMPQMARIEYAYYQTPDGKIGIRRTDQPSLLPAGTKTTGFDREVFPTGNTITVAGPLDEVDKCKSPEPSQKYLSTDEYSHEQYVKKKDEEFRNFFAFEAILAANLATDGLLGRMEGATATAEGTETFYRTMSQANYDTLAATGKIPATSETFISPSLEYAQQYNGVTVQFNMQAGTQNALMGMGVRNSAAGFAGTAYEGLPLVQSGWGSSSAFFKWESENLVNIGLGRGSALNTFNNNIVNFNLIPKP
jgi:hypothetical protein